MVKKSEPRIRYGIDPDTEITVDVRDVLPKKKYRCLKCNGNLERAQGIKNIYHFRHSGKEDCEFYDGGNYENFIHNLRTSEIEKTEKEKKIGIFIEPDKYSGLPKIYGKLPILEYSELIDTSIDEILEKFQFPEYDGFKQKPSHHHFQPSDPEASLELNPNAEKYQLTIDTQDYECNLSGVWQAEPLSENDIFFGSSKRSERIERDKAHKINEGDTVFIILSSKPKEIPKSVRMYELGDHDIISFEISNETKEVFSQFTGIEWLKSGSYGVNVVLPALCEPKPYGPIIEKIGSRAIISVVPPVDTDPEFEVVSIPFEGDEVFTLSKKGRGEPRLFEAAFPEKGSRRLSIHWAGRHQLIHLHTDDDYSPFPTLQKCLDNQKIPKFRIAAKKSDNTLLPWHEEIIKVKINDDIYALKDLGLLFDAPEGLKFDVEAHFPEGKGVDTIVYRTDYTEEKVDRELHSWLKGGMVRLIFQFETLGSIEIELESLQLWEVVPSDAEIIKRLKKIKPLPKKANRKLVRKILGSKPETPSKEYPSGIKKKIRKQLMKLRVNND